MTSHHGPDRRSTAPGSHHDWERVLAAGPGSATLAADLARLTQEGLSSAQAAAVAGRRIGQLLVDAGHFHADVARRVVTMLARSATDDGTVPPALADLLGAVAAEHAAAAQGLLRRQAEVAGAAGVAARTETERALLDELVHQSTHDSLTGLPNRALFLQRLEDAVGASDPGLRVAVLILDLDCFKFINDSRGHAAGDQVLTVAARRIAVAAAGHGGFTARLSGDEFVVLVSGGPEDQNAPGAELADVLLAALDPPIPVEGQRPVHVTASVGVVDVTAGDVDAEEVLRTADLALHAAKEDGTGQVVAHDPSRTTRQLSRFRIAADLPGAIDRGELTLVYQPLVRLDTGLPHSVEALLRWNHPQLGQITPHLFVPIAEDSQVIVALGRWVLEQAGRDLAASPWPAVNINVSVRQLYSPTLVDDVKRCLHDNALAPDRLRVEVTESVIVDDDGAGPLGVLRQLAELGVRIVMDDFGTGYSNLAALRLLPLHEIKLAGTFLSGLRPGLPPDPVDRRILATLVDLSHALGLVVTAENIETREQDHQVRALGCDIGQGHYYGAPGPAVRRRAWLHILE
jgi:diguanylate cyclase (GGDEF)-like protein